MKRIFLPVALACLLTVLPAGCTTGAEFPPHKNSYALGFLTGDVGIVYVRQMDNIDLSKYPHLRLRQGITLRRAVERFMGGDTIGYVTAIDAPTGRGFAVEDMDGVQGGFLFAPLKSAEEALEYTQFMFHEPSSSDYGREHFDINSQQDLDAALSKWKEYQVLKTPPSNVTRVTQQSDGRYLVELVFRVYLGRQRIEYMSCLAGTDGSLEPLDYYKFIEGPPGALL